MKVYTFDTRDLVVWDILKNYYHYNRNQIFNEINAIFRPMVNRLTDIGVPYEKLKNVLIPQKDKLEICFIFDSMKIDNCCYGTTVFKTFIPLLSGIKKVAMFYGDLIGGDSQREQQKIRGLLEQNVKLNTSLDYKHSSQYFLVFLNNITNDKLSKIGNALKELKYYVGYLDLTFSSHLKDIVASTIAQGCIFYNGIVIMPTDEVEDDTNPRNYSMIEFEKYNYTIRNINQIAYSSFLSFKIQRRYYKFDNDDQVFSLNTVVKEPMLIDKYDILIEEKKYSYLLKEKFGVLSIAGLESLEIDQLRDIIRENINTNYIFNMEYNHDFECLKFNTFIDLYSKINSNRQKYILSFEVLNDSKELRLITMY